VPRPPRAKLRLTTSGPATQVRLSDLAPRLAEQEGGSGLDARRDWSSMLSLGEQQRLAFGRLLANRPRLAILDEASSALDLESERAMYQLLEEQVIDPAHPPERLPAAARLRRAPRACRPRSPTGHTDCEAGSPLLPWMLPPGLRAALTRGTGAAVPG
jgi:hypothetical protein